MSKLSTGAHSVDFIPPIILAIVGPSGSGKTTMANILADNGIPTIVSYTTRPMREGETNGLEHWFVKDKDVPPEDQMLAYTRFGGYQYWATRSRIKKICTYVIDEKGLKSLIENYGKRYIIFSIYINRNMESREAGGISKERIERDDERECLNPEDYNFILDNRYTLEEFTERTKEMGIELSKLYQY